MDSIRDLIAKTLNEAHYTTWKKIEVGSPIDQFQDTESEIVSKLAKHFKLGKVLPLGNGTSGFAYYIPNNRVLKITKDKSEAAEAHKILNKKNKSLANIYGVYELHGKYEGTYVIISELLDNSEDITDGYQLLKKYLEDEMNYSISLFFIGYYHGKIDDREIKMYTNDIKNYYEPYKVQIALWFMNGMFKIIKELKENNIQSTDWGTSNLGVKKNGGLAMYDLGYGDTQIPKNINTVHLNEKKIDELGPLEFGESLNEWLSADEYPEFDDGQFNPIFKNRPYLPSMNMNTAPLSEDSAEPQVIQKLALPLEYHYMWGDFLASKGDTIKDIMPNIVKQGIQNVNTRSLVYDMQNKNPELYQDFANWIDQQLHGEPVISEDEISPTITQFLLNKLRAYDAQHKGGGKYGDAYEAHGKTYEFTQDETVAKQAKKDSNKVSKNEFKPNQWAYIITLNKELSESEITPEEVNKKQLPYKFADLFDDFVTQKTEPEIRAIAPNLDLNQDPGVLISDLEKNYPSLFDEFADWIYNTQKDKTTLG